MVGLLLHSTAPGPLPHVGRCACATMLEDAFTSYSPPAHTVMVFQTQQATLPQAEPASTALDIANNPETSPEVLSRMVGKCADDDLLADALALNPNTPLPDLFRLWSDRPLAAVENPILTFQTLSTGKVLHQILPRHVQHKLYVALRSTGRAVELEDQLPVEARLKWIAGPEPDIGWFYRCPGGGIPKVPKDPDDAERIRKEDAFALQFFELLAHDPSAAVRKDMVTKLPTRSLLAYSGEPLADIRMELARRVSSDHGGRGAEEQRVLEILRDALSRDAEVQIRCCIAAGGPIENPIFERLAQDTSLLVRIALAGRSVANRTALCRDAWQALADTNTDLARLVALNHACPFPLRFRLTEHSDLQVRKNAWSTLEFRDREKRRLLLRRASQLLLTPSIYPELRAIAGNKTIPQPLAAKIARMKGPLRAIVAGNPQLGEAERRLLLSGTCVASARVALQHATENETLWVGLRHPSEAVRSVLVRKQGIHAVRIRFRLAKDPSVALRHELVKYLVDPKNEDPLDRKFARSQLRLLLDSCTQTEKDLFLKNKRLRRLLALWRTEPATNQSTTVK
jgi:hypothetical protein